MLKKDLASFGQDVRKKLASVEHGVKKEVARWASVLKSSLPHLVKKDVGFIWARC